MAKVLIIDDDPIVLRLCSKQLLLDGHTPIVASSGAEGLMMAEMSMPDIILVDYMMPLMRGTDVLVHLRNSEWGKGIPTIMITAASSVQFLPEIVHADLVLYKPVLREELHTMIERLVAKSALA